MKKEKTFFSADLKTVCGDEFNHLVNVWRAKVGDEIKIINGSEFEYTCKITEILKKEAKIVIENKKECAANFKNAPDFFVCTLKQDKNDLIVEKLSELGINNLALVESEFVSRLGNVNKERLNKIAVSASKQCRRSTFLNIEADIKFSKMLERIKNYDLFLVAFENEKKLKLADFKVAGRVAVLIGSEGGFSQNEIEQLKKAGAKIFSLGSRIQRAETAVICTASLLSEKLGGL